MPIYLNNKKFIGAFYNNKKINMIINGKNILIQKIPIIINFVMENTNGEKLNSNYYFKRYFPINVLLTDRQVFNIFNFPPSMKNSFHIIEDDLNNVILHKNDINKVYDFVIIFL